MFSEEALKHPYIMPEEVDFTKPEKFFDSSFENYSSAQWSSLTFIQELFCTCICASASV